MAVSLAPPVFRVHPTRMTRGVARANEWPALCLPRAVRNSLNQQVHATSAARPCPPWREVSVTRSHPRRPVVTPRVSGGHARRRAPAARREFLQVRQDSPLPKGPAMTQNHAVPGRNPRSRYGGRPTVWAMALAMGLSLGGQVQARGDDAAEARKHAQRASNLAASGKCRQAVAEWNKAMAILRDPALLFNRGECYRKLGDADAALEDYRQFLNDLPKAPNRGEVERRIAELTAQKIKVKAKEPAPPPPPPAPVTVAPVVVPSPPPPPPRPVPEPKPVAK